MGRKQTEAQEVLFYCEGVGESHPSGPLTIRVAKVRKGSRGTCLVASVKDTSRRKPCCSICPSGQTVEVVHVWRHVTDERTRGKVRPIPTRP